MTLDRSMRIREHGVQAVCAIASFVVAGCSDPGASTPPSVRLIAPLSTATVTSNRPTLHWRHVDGTDGAAHVEICSDRACSQIEQRFDGNGSSGTPETALARGVHFWRVRGESSAFSFTWEFFVGAGTSTVDSSWGEIPDVNGDGHVDLVVGARDAGLFVYLGTASGPSETPTRLRVGTDVSVAGDVNGDGFVDLIVTGMDGASASILFGGPNGINSTPLRFGGVRPHAAGDINGDGYADVVSGGTIFLGAPTGFTEMPMQLVAPMGTIELRSAGAGDVNGDGHADLVVAGMESFQVGRPYLYLGGPSGLAIAPVALPVPASGTTVGFFAALGAGDVNGDGFADVAFSGSNTAYVYLGSATASPVAPIEITAPPGSSQFAVSMAAGGDVNGDGRADLVIGDWGSDRAFVYLGSVTGVETLGRTLALFGADSFGYGVAGGGDLDNDGFDDVRVGAPGPIGTAGPSAAYIFHGSANGPMEATTITPPAMATGFGWTVASRTTGRSHPSRSIRAHRSDS